MTNFNLRVEGFKLKDGVRQGLDAKLSSIDKLFPRGTFYDVFIKKTSNNDYKCEIRVQNGKSFIRSEATGSRIEYSINNTIKLLKKRVYKLKSMRIDKKRRHFVEDVNIEETPLVGFDEILRTKIIKATLMSEEDAIIELESLNHDFFIFRNTNKSEMLCVIYRREVGYGLIIIE